MAHRLPHAELAARRGDVWSTAPGRHRRPRDGLVDRELPPVSHEWRSDECRSCPTPPSCTSANDAANTYRRASEASRWPACRNGRAWISGCQLNPEAHRGMRIDIGEPRPALRDPSNTGVIEVPVEIITNGKR